MAKFKLGDRVVFQASADCDKNLWGKTGKITAVVGTDQRKYPYYSDVDYMVELSCPFGEFAPTYQVAKDLYLEAVFDEPIILETEENDLYKWLNSK
jgi:hypothetical protein